MVLNFYELFRTRSTVEAHRGFAVAGWDFNGFECL
jgi:hypothetical protein